MTQVWPDTTEHTPIATTTSPLRWTNASGILSSDLARRLHRHQHNASLPIAHTWFRNRFGLGSDLHVWSQALCNAMELGYRLETVGKWIWAPNGLSSLFSMAQLVSSTSSTAVYNVSRGKGRVGHECPQLMQQYNVSEWRRASMEFLFQSLSPSILQEAERQHRLVFDGRPTPSPLFTVHVRWGDKADEAQRIPMERYIEAVRALSLEHGDDEPVHVYLATEDPEAVHAWQRAVPSNWTTYVDQVYYEGLPYRQDEYNNNPHLAQKLPNLGVQALASLLVALEANDFVLTTSSNWSRLMNELRQSVLEGRGISTRLIDLQPGEW